MIYKPGDLPDFKYAGESLKPRVIGCTLFYPLGDSFICVGRVITVITLFLLR